MGVPKFYRWISERYPSLSTVAREYQLPEFDNLYLDMNGIIHVCSHPNDSDAHFRITEEEIFNNIFDYIDFIFRMVKPKKVFFMAVDGVAPRAKMNQQRDRRFRSAKEAEEIEKEARRKGEELPKEKRFDSNCISPGTEFMQRLHEQLKYFVVKKLSTDSVWQNQELKIFLSGHNAPGEGEHKVMDFIRYLRSQDSYDPNTRHCIYGQDADLIMLALCTHEPHITLLREEVVFGKQAQKRVQSADKVTFHLLHISLLREYLDHEFAALKPPGVLKQGYSLESIVDDWLLLCFFVGNDFLPHLPNLHIAHDALPILQNTYCEVMPTLNGYLHDQGLLNLKNCEVFLRKLGERDLDVFGDKKDDLKYLKGKISKDLINEARQKFPELDILDTDSDENTDISQEEFRQHKRHYYMSKLDYDEVTEDVLREQAKGYIRAVQWNLHYYYNGVQSWNWYYPHHYSPYISDIKDFSDFEIKFQLGEPFLPFQQLVSIMPAASKELVPHAYRYLMCHEDSPLKAYFPDDFETDLNGKTQQWEAVVLIKYIEEDILLNSMRAFDHLLTDAEKMRNKHGPHLLFELSNISLGDYASPLPNSKWFPTVANSRAKCTEIPHNTFRIKPELIKKGRLPNAKDSLHFPGFPSLRHLPHTSVLVKQGCTVFQQPSRGFNMLINIVEQPSELSRFLPLVGKVVHIGYPHLQQAVLTKVSDGKKLLTTGGSRDLDDLEVKEFPRRVDSISNTLRQRWGIEVGNTNEKLLVSCKPLTGRKYICTSSEQVTLECQWSEQEITVLHETLVCGLRERELQVAQFRTIPEVFKKSCLVYILTPDENYGQQGVIVGYAPDGYLLVESRLYDEPDFAEVHKKEAALRKNNYLPAFRIARELGLESHWVARLTGSVQVQINSTEADVAQVINIGMNLKFNKKNEEVIGYSKRLKLKDGRIEWRFSEAAVAALRELIAKFGEFYLSLMDCADMDKIPLEKCFTEDSYKDGLNKAREVAKWIKEQPFSKAPKQKSGGIVFDEGVVEEIEKYVLRNSRKAKGEVTIKVHASHVYMPGLHIGLFAPDSQTYFSLYDRVVNVRSDITVPLGLKGTVIGIYRSDDESSDTREAMYDVLFDEEFSTGVASRGAKGRRVATLSVVSMINISHGQRLYQHETLLKDAVRRGHDAWTNVKDKSSSARSAEVTTQQRIHKDKPADGQGANNEFSLKFRETHEKAKSNGTDEQRSSLATSASSKCAVVNKVQHRDDRNSTQKPKARNNFTLNEEMAVNGEDTSSSIDEKFKKAAIFNRLFNDIEGLKASLGRKKRFTASVREKNKISADSRLVKNGIAQRVEGIPISVKDLFGSFTQTPRINNSQPCNHGLTSADLTLKSGLAHKEQQIEHRSKPIKREPLSIKNACFESLKMDLQKPERLPKHVKVQADSAKVKTNLSEKRRSPNTGESHYSQLPYSVFTEADYHNVPPPPSYIESNRIQRQPARRSVVANFLPNRSTKSSNQPNSANKILNTAAVKVEEQFRTMQIASDKHQGDFLTPCQRQIGITKKKDHQDPLKRLEVEPNGESMQPRALKNNPFIPSQVYLACTYNQTSNEQKQECRNYSIENDSKPLAASFNVGVQKQSRHDELNNFIPSLKSLPQRPQKKNLQPSKVFEVERQVVKSIQAGEPQQEPLIIFSDMTVDSSVSNSSHVAKRSPTNATCVSKSDCSGNANAQTAKAEIPRHDTVVEIHTQRPPRGSRLAAVFRGPLSSQ